MCHCSSLLFRRKCMGFFSIRCLPSLHIGQTVYYSSLTGVATLPTYKNKMNRSCIFASQENLSATFALLYLMLTLLLIMVVTGNTLFLTAFWRTSSLHTSSNALLAGLATADLGVGLITLPSGIFHLTEIPSRCRSPFGLPSWKVTQRSGSFFTIASILTLAAIAVDRLMAIRLHMRYKEIVTVSRIKIVLASSWLLAVVSVCLIHLHPPTAPVFLFSMFTLLSIIMLYSHINVFVTACHHKRQMQLQASVLHCNQQNAYNTVHYKKSVLTMFYIVGLFWSVTFLQPFLLFSNVLESSSHPNKIPVTTWLWISLLFWCVWVPLSIHYSTTGVTEKFAKLSKMSWKIFSTTEAGRCRYVTK